MTMTTPPPAQPAQLDPIELLEHARREDVALLSLVLSAVLAVAAISLAVAILGA
jgi:hypothetical protein